MDSCSKTKDATFVGFWYNCWFINSEKKSLFQSEIFWLAILTTIGFQVLSNFANDYGDGIRGVDDDREGEKRMVASGLISAKQMKYGIIITAFVTLSIAVNLIYAAFGWEDFFNSSIVSCFRNHFNSCCVKIYHW